MKFSTVLALSVLIIIFPLNASSKEYQLSSPDSQIEIRIYLDQQIKWSVDYKNKLLIHKSPVSLVLEGDRFLGKEPVMKKIHRDKVQNEIRPVVPNKSSLIIDECNAIKLDFEQDYSLTFRAHNDGVAYRFSTRYPQEITVKNEEFQIHLPEDIKSYFPEEESLISHYERKYLEKNLSEIPENTFCSLPVLLQTKDSHYLLVTESDLYDYPCLFLSGTQKNALKGLFPQVVLETKPAERSPDRYEVITQQAGYIAKTKGTRDFPWRVFLITDKPKTLVESSLVFQLASPLKISNPEWIRPGKVAWDWWNALNIYGVDFVSGINTETYKYYIDFASEYGLEYIILDEGWSKTTTNVKEPNPEINVKELISYGRDKNVGIILWLLWKPLDRDMDNTLATYAQWGAEGVKVDFMQRADQYMVNFYQRTAEIAAKHKLVVDFHGAFKPAGLRRAYPNVLTYEGVKGLENCKWSRDITPKHDLTLPFIRMVAGPMDYTPGAMINAQKLNFAVRYTRPMSQGTRCHQIALYIVYESPLQMLCDTPSNYDQETECTRFISNIPVVWDETIVLKAEVSEYIVLARRRGETWYLGALTNWTPREFELDLSFLDQGTYSAEIMEDGINAHRHAEDYKKTKKEVSAESPLHIKMASGGGWAAVLSKKEKK
ncbi:MAG: glycoside hydrolase family 97 protein [Candidatus Aminicenantes bacterium]|nr:glycoside hydrolase family 97 protein [Candidatus Aminicenantes bacterium]